MPVGPADSNPFLETSALTTQTGGAIPSFYAGASDYTATSCICNGLGRTYAAIGVPFRSPGANSYCGGQYLGDRRLGVLTFDAFRIEHVPISIETITDGTSQTIFCGELAGRPDLWQHGVKKTAKSISLRRQPLHYS